MTGPAAVPTATYRLQIRQEFGFAAAAEQAAYLHALGVSHVYLSPILQAVTGSAHGYDVVDHARISAEAGGLQGFDAFAAAARARGLGVVVDLVPNHMAMPTPVWHNRRLWRLLRDGPASRYAAWFDVDWAAAGGRIVLPVLGEPLADVVAGGAIDVTFDGGPAGKQWVVRYADHEFPVRRGTELLDLPGLLDAQFYRLEHWAVANRELNYRRFFDVTTLLGLRVEDPEVFAATHRLIRSLVADGSVDGLRIDHPDGLADPRGYLRALAEATGGVWVVVEKILEGDERLPEDWSCAGTTGYDTLWRVGGVFVDPAGSGPLREVLARFDETATSAAEVAAHAKQTVGLRVQEAEVERLVRLLTSVVAALAPPPEATDPATLRRATGALLVGMDRYRAYIHPGEPATAEALAALDGAAERAETLVDEHEAGTVRLVRDLASGRIGPLADPVAEAARGEFVTRFQQTCGPVMAKSVEDTAFYRWHHLIALNEVGADPGVFGLDPTALHEFAARILADWPTTMTTLSTHDTKRSEDTRARLAPLSELAQDWAAWVQRAHELAVSAATATADPATEYFLWQTLVATWPVTPERFGSYALKAIREAGQHTSWVEPDAAYESGVQVFADWVLDAPDVAAHVEAWLERTAAHVRVVTLGQKVLQLLLPGVPDVYQGAEVVDRSLVDPDNRRPVDYAARRTRLARLDAGAHPQDLDDEKLLVTSRALRLRRDHPAWFGPGSTYAALPATSECALAFGRGVGARVEVVVVATRLLESLTRSGGWGEHTVGVPPGDWVEVFTGSQVGVGRAGTPLAGLLERLPVALLVRRD